MIRDRIGNMVGQNFQIVVGDANVVVYCSREICRNSVGEWNTRPVSVDSKLKERAFYTQKDKAMAAEADYGFVLWDGESAGSIANVFELLKHEKSVAVYFAPEKRFFTISPIDDAKALLKRCDAKAVNAINKKVNLRTALAEIQNAAQGRLLVS